MRGDLESYHRSCRRRIHRKHYAYRCARPMPYISLYPTRISVPKCVTLAKRNHCTSTVHLVHGSGPFPAAYNFVYRRPYRTHYHEGVMSSTVGVHKLGHVTTSCTNGIPPPRYTPSAKGHVTIMNNKPNKLDTTCCLRLVKRRAAMFRVLPGLNKVLHCKVPGCELPGSHLSRSVRTVLRAKIRMRFKGHVNGSVAVRDLHRRCSTILVSVNTDASGGLNVRNRRTRNIVSTISFLHSIKRSGDPSLAKRRITIVNNNGISVSTIHATGHLNTGGMDVICEHHATSVATLPTRVRNTITRKVRMLALGTPSEVRASRGKRISNVCIAPRVVDGVGSNHTDIYPANRRSFLVPYRALVITVNRSVRSRRFTRTNIPISHNGVVARHCNNFSGVPNMFTNKSYTSKPTSMVGTVTTTGIITTGVSRCLNFRRVVDYSIRVPRPHLDSHRPYKEIRLARHRTYDHIYSFRNIRGYVARTRTGRRSREYLHYSRFNCNVFGKKQGRG